MKTEEENIDVKKIEKPQPQKRSWAKRLFIFFVFTISAILITLAGFIASFQIPSFRKFYAKTISNVLSDQLEAKVEFSDLKITGLVKLELENVRIITAKDTLANVPIIELDVSLLKSNIHNVYINKIYLQNPVIKLIRNEQDSTWNFTHIAKPTPKDNSPKEKLILKLNISDLGLNNAKILVNDRLNKEIKHTFNPFKNDVRFLNLRLSSTIDLTNNVFKANISDLNFKDFKSKVFLQSGKARIELNEKQIEIIDLELKSRTADLKLNAKAENLNIFKPIGDKEVNEMKLTVKLDSKNFDGEYIEIFAPMPTKFGEVDKINLIASGTLAKLNITQMKVAKNNSHIDFSAELNDLTKGNEISYSVEIRKSSIIKSDVASFIPKADISFLPNANKLDIAYLNGQGTTKDVSASLDFTSDIGNLTGNFELNFSNPDLEYSSDLNLENFNLAGITKDSTSKTLITGKLIAKGTGIDPKKLKGDYKLQANNSIILGNEVNSLNFDLRADNSKLDFDTLIVDFGYPKNIESSTNKEKSTLNVSGFIDLSKIEPVYKFNLNFEALNLEKILKTNQAPEYATGEVKIEGESFDLDKIIGSVKSKFDVVEYGDRSILPFKFDATFDRDSNQKVFNFNSTFFDATIEGQFSYANLIKSVSDQADYLADFFSKKYKNLIPDKIHSSIENSKVLNNSIFDEIDCHIIAKVKDLSPLSIFLGDTKIVNTSNFELSIKSDSVRSQLIINHFDIKNFGLDNKGLNLSTFQTNLKGNLNLSYANSERKFDSFDLEMASDRKLQVNDLIFDKPLLKLNFDGNNINFISKSNINKDLDFNLEGKAALSGNSAEIYINKLYLSYADFAKFHNLDVIKANFNSEVINISNLMIAKDSIEIISINGNYFQEQEKFNNVNIIAENIDIAKLLSKFKIRDANLKTLQGNVKNATLLLNGTASAPELKLDIQTGNLKISGKTVGSLSGNLNHTDSLVSGLLKIESFDNKILATNLEVKVISLPLNLGLKNVKNRIHNDEQFNIITSIKDLNLKLVSPFIPEITNLSGLANGSLFINGYAPDKVNYVGRVQVNNVSFLTNASNINYLAEGRLELVKDTLKFLNVDLRNTNEDNAKSQANLYGNMTMKDFDFKKFDFTINAKNILILSDDSKKTMPNMYGKFKIATGDRPLRFFGTFDRPNLEGSVNILDADITMPAPDLAQNVSSKFEYRRRNDGKILITINEPVTDTSTTKASNNTELEESKEFVASTSFNDLMNYEIDVKFPGKFKVEMGLPAFTVMTTFIGTEDKTRTLRYEKPRGSKNMSLQGEINVFNNSTMLLLGKKMNLIGKLSFPIGSIENPTLNMVASYKGKTKVDNLEKEYDVEIIITGTKKEPKLAYSYKIANESQQGDSNAIFQDIVYLFAFGKTYKELNKSGNIGGGQTNILDQSLNKSSSVLLSSTLNQLTNKLMFVKNVDIDFQGSIENSRINLQGDIIGGLEWSVGGNLNNISNPEFVIDAPLTILGIPNLLLQYKYINNTNQTQTQDQIRWESKIKYGSSW